MTPENDTDRTDAGEADNREAQKIAGDHVLQEIARAKLELLAEFKRAISHVASPLLRGNLVHGWDVGFDQAVALFMGASSPSDQSPSTPEPSPQKP